MSKPIDISGMKYRDAFHAFFHSNFADNLEEGAMYLFQCAATGGPDNLIWAFLERTGDKNYTPDTFRKAAQLILDEAFEPEVA